MSFYKTFVLPIIKERFDLEVELSTSFEEVTKEVEFVSDAVYTDWTTVLGMHITNLN